MFDSLDDLLAGIRAYEFVCPEYYAELDCDAALDQRDAHAGSDSAWADVYKATELSWRDVPAEIYCLVDTIRKEAFLIVSRATAQHEIAGYVSDDFDLLCRCQILGIEHPLLNHLWQAYSCGSFPVIFDQLGDLS
jgi:hypothetical protein